MLRIFTLLLIVGMMFAAVPADAQFVTGCVEGFVETLQPASETFDLSSACVTYDACAARGETYEGQICQMDFALELMNQCADDVCFTELAILANAVRISDLTSNNYYLEIEHDLIIEMLLQTLQAYHSEGAEVALNTITDLHLVRGIHSIKSVLHAEMGDYETAQSELLSDLDYSFFEPMVYLTGVTINAQNDDLTAAGLDALMLAQMLDDYERFDELATDLTTRYPLAFERSEQWVAYPESYMNGGVAGRFTAYLVGEPGVELTLHFVEDTILIEGLRETGHWYLGTDMFDLIPLYKFNGRHVNAFQSPSDSSSYFSLRDDVLTLDIGFFEGWGAAVYRVAPVGEPDPRSIPDDALVCENAPPSRLQVGDLVTSAYWDGGNPFYDEPGDWENEVGRLNIQNFFLLEGPVCAGDAI